MKVLVITNEPLKNELEEYPFSNELQIEWTDNLDNRYLNTNFDACIDLLFENKKERIEWLKQLAASLIIVNSVIITLKEIQGTFIRINGWPSFLKRPVVEAACENELMKQKTENLFLLLGRKTEWTEDITGFLTPRIVASVINEAFIALEEKVSTEEEIDIAMKLGTNYPYGPFEWGRKIGLKNILSLLDTLSKEQERYHPCDLLKQTALI